MKSTNVKGQLGLIKACHKLLELGYTTYLPFGEPKDKVDLIAKIDNQIITFQVKHSCITSKNFVEAKKYCYSYIKNGLKKYTYQENDFNYYILYIVNFDVIIFVPSTMMGVKIKCEIPNSTVPFYWWEDFQEIKSNHVKRTKYDLNADG